MDLTSLVMVPDAPRVSGSSYPRNWDWRIIETDEPLTRMRRTGNNADDDSAFGSAESAKLTEDVATPEVLQMTCTTTTSTSDHEIGATKKVSYFLLN